MLSGDDKLLSFYRVPRGTSVFIHFKGISFLKWNKTTFLYSIYLKGYITFRVQWKSSFKIKRKIVVGNYF